MIFSEKNYAFFGENISYIRFTPQKQLKIIRVSILTRFQWKFDVFPQTIFTSFPLKQTKRIKQSSIFVRNIVCSLK